MSSCIVYKVSDGDEDTWDIPIPVDWRNPASSLSFLQELYRYEPSIQEDQGQKDIFGLGLILSSKNNLN